MWMIGGAAQSPVWPGIVADATGVPLSLPQYKHWPTVGAAILAGVGIGAFETLAAGQARFQWPARQIEPDTGRMSIYDRCFSTYQQLGRAFAEITAGRSSLLSEDTE
jgi:sugar (pentulose or hexulose) kinase